MSPVFINKRHPPHIPSIFSSNTPESIITHSCTREKRAYPIVITNTIKETCTD
uniref:Uncharacterized protein n=1 Tax=Arundo donax TaxID=35708 RepID=A0A0A9G7Z9_ARUDO